MGESCIMEHSLFCSLKFTERVSSILKNTAGVKAVNKAKVIGLGMPVKADCLVCSIHLS